MVTEATQLTVCLDNKPGQLAKLCRAMAKAGVNLQALTVVESADQCQVRFVPNKVRSAKRVAAAAACCAHEASVLVVDLANRAGELAKLSGKLARAKVNIEYAYGSAGGTCKTCPIVLRVSNLRAAMRALK